MSRHLVTAVHLAKAMRWRPLTAALLVALALPGIAFAQTAKEKELEARVAQLEAMVQQLVSQQQQQQTAIGEVKTAQTQAPVAAASAMPATAGKPTIQSTPITPGAIPGTTFSYGGYIKLDAMVTDTSDGEIADGSAGRLFYLPSTIPVGGVSEGNPDTDIHAQFSRFWLSADTTLETGDKLKGFIEVDFWGGGSNAFLGNETSTNTFGVAVRHAYASWNEWLAGQTWSNFQDTAALPDSVDFVGVTDGTIFVRQAQLRYTKGPWSFSVENPETTITPFGNVGARIASDDNSVPDVTARWLTKGAWGHFSVAGLLRQFKYQNVATNIDESATGGAISVSGRFNVGANDDLRYMVSGGPGLGRYLAFGLGSDTMTNADGSLEPLDGYGGFVAWRHAFSPKLRGNLMYSAAYFDNDVAITGLNVTEGSQSWHVNLIYSPLPKLDLGAELSWGQRSLESGEEGDLSRLHTTVKYSF